MTKFTGLLSVSVWILAIFLNFITDVSDNGMIISIGCLICGIWILEGKK